ncbi:hypothetical protein [Saccharicrinis sp. FJH54]|uniref:hypothetical protein n=1 Tax=Saccharicrinis sp. FJH54 TaxID=3344665 RepID=UPI0035D529C1
MRFYFLFLSLLTLSVLSAQNREISGKVIDNESRLPIAYAMITIDGVGDIVSSEDGTWKMKTDQTGQLIIYAEARGYTKNTLVLPADENFLLIELTKDEFADVTKIDLSQVVVTDDEDDLDNQQSATGMLTSSKDVFDKVSSYEFGVMRFNERGLDSRYYNLWFNGAPVNDMETGRATYGIFGGLNDAVRNQEVIGGMANSDFDFGQLGGSGYIYTSPFLYRTGLKTTLSSANRNYRNRVMMTYSTGMLKGNWAVTASLSKRWAEEGYVPGTFYDAYAGFLSVGKRFGTKHDLTFTAFAAPSRSGRNSAITKEAAELTGTNYYNPYWGYQNGEKRNSRVSSYFEPTGILNYKWQISDKTKLTTVLSYSRAKNGYTALNWLRGKDPRPDYYRYFPSYYKDNEINYNIVRSYWLTQPDVTGQVNWQNLYDINRRPMTVTGVDGNPDAEFTGLVSSYIIENRVTEKNSASANMIFNHELSERLNLNAGASYRYYDGRHYNVVEDLLGGEYFYDIDKFAERDFPDPQIAYNDLNNPGRLLKEGDKYSHDYAANVRTWETWAELAFNTVDFDAFLSAKLSGTEFWRTGYTKKGLFPDNSYGESEHSSFLNYGIHGGLDYKISGRHILRANAMYMTQAPYVRNAFVSPRTRNQIVDGLKSEVVYGGEASYIFRLPSLTGRITGYYNKFEDNTEVVSFYHDAYQNLLNYILTGIDTRHRGMEFGFEYTIMDGLKTSAVVSLGEYVYTSRPTIQAYVDNQAALVEEESGVVYAKGFYVPGTPQTAASWGMDYRGSKNWWAGFNVNYLADRYLDFNPARRTTNAVQGLNLNNADDFALYHKIIDQERISDAYYTNVFVGKSWYLGKYYLIASLNISNVFNNQDIVTGGYEQYRFDYTGKDPNKYPNKYYYAYGRNYFLNVSLSF